MNKNGKKYRRSAVSVACYVIAAAMLVYVCYQIGNTVSTINEYYAQYGMSGTPMEYITYSLQSALQPIVYMIVIFMLGYILDAVRMNNKSNYRTDEEIIAAKQAKKQAKEARKLAKGEEAAAKAGYVPTDEKSVEADFAKSLDAELKADAVLPKAEVKPESKTENKTANKKPRSNYNRPNGSRNSSGSGSSDANRKKPEGGGNRSNSGSRSGGNGQRRNSNRKPAADKPKTDDAAKAKSGDGFEVVINDTENK